MKNKILNILFAAIVAIFISIGFSSCCNTCGYNMYPCEVNNTGILGIVNHLDVPIQIEVFWNGCEESALESTDRLFMGVGQYTTFYEQTPICSGVMRISAQGYTIENNLKSIYTELCTDAEYQIYPRNDSVAYISSGSHTYNRNNVIY